MGADKFNLGIKNAVHTCMNVQKDDRVVVLTDLNAQKIGQALVDESSAAGAQAILFKLEDYGSRPMTELPEDLFKEWIDFMPTVTFFAAGSQEGELKLRGALGSRTRQAFIELGHPIPRHGHMVNISESLIREGMTADYVEINRLTYKVLDIVKDAKIIEVTSLKGTEVTAEFNPDYNWVPCHGLYHQPGDWGNLPEGEVFTCPWDLNGKLVVDVLGDHFSPKYGVLEHPLTIEVENGLAQDAHCQNQSLVKEFLAYLDSAENGRRAGEFAIGTNIAVKELSGNLLQDEKIPGIHVAFGNPYPGRTGADWQSSVHVDVVPVGCTIHVDGKTIMDTGEFILD
jgi:leucyl aminopeptidase (aminopeptidase T)